MHRKTREVEDLRTSLESRFVKLNAALDWRDEKVRILQDEVTRGARAESLERLQDSSTFRALCGTSALDSCQPYSSAPSCSLHFLALFRLILYGISVQEAASLEILQLRRPQSTASAPCSICIAELCPPSLGRGGEVTELRQQRDSLQKLVEEKDQKVRRARPSQSCSARKFDPS